MLCLFSCKNSNKNIVISGEIEGLENEMILVYGANNQGDALDTIYTVNGKFEYKAPIDTFSQVILLFKDFQECPIFVDKGDKVNVFGKSSSLELLHVDGGEVNEVMNEFKESIADLLNKTSDIKSQIYAAYLSNSYDKYLKLKQSPLLLKSEDEIKTKAEAFISSHSESPVSIYLLNRYFVQSENPDVKKIREITAKMSGILKDNPFIQNLEKSISTLSILEVGRSAPYFTLVNNKKNIVSLANFKNKYVLLHFWATWSEQSLKENSLLRKLKAQFNADDFNILSISLDLDKKIWNDALKADSLVGKQVCDFTGWNNYAVIQYGVESLPKNVLIDPQGKIIASGSLGSELIKKIEEILRKDLSTK